MYSLWRGGTCLGSIAETQPVMHHGERVGAAGILEPNDPLEETSCLMQVRSEMLPHSPTFQSPKAIQWIGNPQPPTTPMYPSFGVLEPMSEEESRGVPPEKVFELRNDGSPLDIQFISLSLFRFVSDADARKWREATGIQSDRPEFWMVMFASRPQSEDTPPSTHR